MVPQDDDSEEAPAHGFPLYSGRGLSQARILFRIPPPQDLLHEFQELHPPQFPCSTMNKYMDSKDYIFIYIGQFYNKF